MVILLSLLNSVGLVWLTLNWPSSGHSLYYKQKCLGQMHCNPIHCYALKVSSQEHFILIVHFRHATCQVGLGFGCIHVFYFVIHTCSSCYSAMCYHWNMYVWLEAALRRPIVIWHQSTARVIPKHIEPFLKHIYIFHSTLMSYNNRSAQCHFKLHTPFVSCSDVMFSSHMSCFLIGSLFDCV